jgi:hypothetical protein
MLESALSLARVGWRVHPVHGIVNGICTCGAGASCRTAGKHPVLMGWVQEASNDESVIRSWDWTDRNVGIVPDGFTILDFDPKAGGMKTLERMAAVLPELPDAPVVRTGSGGLHIYIAGTAKSAVGVLPGFDVRGTGGQAVAPPSLHFSGERYEWLNGPCKSPQAPEWLEVARGNIPDELTPSTIVTVEDLKKIKGKHEKAIKKMIAREVFAESGTRNETATSIAGTFARRWPFADPQQLVELVGHSLDITGEPTRDVFRARLTKFQLQQRETLSQQPPVTVTVDIDEMSDQAIQILAESNVKIYSRGGGIVQVRAVEDLPDGVLRATTPLAFEPIHAANLAAILSSKVSWMKPLKNGELSKVLPPPPVVQRIYFRGEWPNIPHAERITEGMILRPDGTIFPGGGYDAYTGTVCVGHADNTPPTSVEEALSLLLEVVEDFPFSGPAHRSAWVASVLTAVAQQLFRGPSPAFLIDANVRASGKTLLAEAAIEIATGRSPSRASLGHDPVEDRKQITRLAIDGAQVILVDNITGSFGTGVLAEALTLRNSTWDDRILGESKGWHGPFKPAWFMTANNVTLKADMPRRCCYCRLDSPLERPENRSDLRHPALLSWISERRLELYRAAVSILHHFILAGRPQQELPEWGTYEGWSALIRQAIVWTGLPDPADTREDLKITDEDQELAESLLSGLLVIDGEFSPSMVHTKVFGVQTLGESEKYKGLKEALEAGCVQRGKYPTAQSIGRLFAKYRNRVVGGRSLVKTGRKGSWWQVA